MHYIFKYVQLYIKVLRISLKKAKNTLLRMFLFLQKESRKL
jgi:hypothetical protein